MPQSVQTCPVEEAIRVIGGKWKLLLLRSLLLNGPQRYNDLLKTVTAISQKELTRNLHELTEAGLINRGDGNAHISLYSLTPLGSGLMPIFQEMLSWGENLLKTRN